MARCRVGISGSGERDAPCDMEISRTKHLIDTKNDMNMKMMVGATTLLFMFAQHEYTLHTEGHSGDDAQ